MVSFGRFEFSIGVGVAGLLVLATYLWLDSTSSGSVRVGHEYGTLLTELQKQQQHVLSEIKKQHDEMIKEMNSQHNDQKRLLLHQQSQLLTTNQTVIQQGIVIENKAVQEQIEKMANEQIEWLQKLQTAVLKLRKANDAAQSEALSKSLLEHFEVLYKMHSLLEPIVNQSFIINEDKPIIEPPKVKNYYITIIMVLRNDDYGGNMAGRLSNWLELFSHIANQKGLAEDVEVMFVEWNPVKDKPLSDLMKTVLPKDKKFPIRIISVPNEIHASIENPNRIEVYEYMAKNVGMRRALGKFILCTNPDSLFNPSIVEFLAKRKLSEKAFYTMYRTFDNFQLPGGTTQQKIEALEDKSRYDPGHFTEPAEQELCKDGFMEESKFPRRAWPIDDAPGDFYMISKEGAFKFRGFSQRNQNFNLDSFILCQSLAHGFAQLVPRAPCLLVHQAHNRPPSYGYTTPMWNIQASCGNLLSQKSPQYPPIDNGGENWGWADVQLPEVTL